MGKRIVIYGWVIPIDRIRGPGSGALVDLVYFVDDQVDVGDVYRIIQHAGYKIIPKRIGNRRDAPVEQDKIQVEDWDNVIVGSEKLPEPENRYEYPPQGFS